MKKIFLLILIILISGCAGIPRKTKKNSQVFSAKFAEVPVKIDGKLDDAVWKKANVYKLNLAKNKTDKGKELNEAGEIQFAWDKNYFYLGIKFSDSDIIAGGKSNQIKHYNFGDVCELFLKPEGNSWYWELYVTPADKKSSLFIPGCGRVGLLQNFDYKCGLKVAAKCNGTLNNWKDKDKYWTAEMAMPVKNLTEKGDKFGPGSEWKVLVSRYNYGRYFKGKGAELSSAPQLSSENFHLLKEFAKIKFNR